MGKSILGLTVLGFVASSLLSGCASAPPRRPPPPAAAAARPRPDAGRRHAGRAQAQPARRAIARRALDLVGTPYRYGGATPAAGFDCSGLVFYTYEQSGLSVPRTAAAQFRQAKKIALAQAAAGDLVFFADQRKLSHVGIYLGHDLFVHAPETGREVSVASLDTPYYRRHLVAVGRILRR
jgi:cell wall-associated NlpC family hydrolase